MYCLKILLEQSSPSFGVSRDQLWILLKCAFWFSRSEGNGVGRSSLTSTQMVFMLMVQATVWTPRFHDFHCTEFWNEKYLKQVLGCFCLCGFLLNTPFCLSLSLPHLLFQCVPTSVSIKEYFHKKWKYTRCSSCVWRHKDSKLPLSSARPCRNPVLSAGWRGS